MSVMFHHKLSVFVQSESNGFKHGKMELTQMILLALAVLAAFLRGCRAEKCDPKPLIIRHEGNVTCVYNDTRGIKTIGVGYNMQNKDARKVFNSIGADYDKFMNGQVAKSGMKITCNCGASVPCLNESQINMLLDISLERAIKDAKTVINTFDSLCCSVQNAMVDMSYTLGGTKFRAFTTFAGLVDRQYWKAAGDDLTISKWCNDYDTKKRCMEVANVVRKGCKCKQTEYFQACDANSSACCPREETCCQAKLTFKNTRREESFDELLCCKGGTSRCPELYTVLCKDQEGLLSYCCPADHPNCKNGHCYKDGVAAGSKSSLVTSYVGIPTTIFQPSIIKGGTTQMGGERPSSTRLFLLFYIVVPVLISHPHIPFGENIL